jgi:drug/metabolite transporter (DMT)-like permease
VQIVATTAEQQSGTATMIEPRLDRATLVAFLALLAVGGLTANAVRVSNADLPPLWGAFLRIGLASLVLFGVVAIWRLPLPGGRALTGAILFGAANFGASQALFYWGVVRVPAGLAQVLMSLIPLMTLLLATVHKTEKVRARTMTGSLLATAGMAVVWAEQLSLAVPFTALLAIVGSAVFAAEAGVLIKAFPTTNIVTFNAVSMGFGAVLLLVSFVLAQEHPVLPNYAATWAALAYLIFVGTIGVFTLYVFVLQRWTASAASYQFVLFPFVTVAVGAAFAGERITSALLGGAALVVIGVYVGALRASGRS